MNEISREAKELVENVSIDRTVKAWESRCIAKCDEIKRLKEELDNEQEHANGLWDKLLEAKGELEKYDWKQGHPEHENEVLICTDNYGKKFYTTNSWKKGEYWNNLFQGKYIAYAEIRPFGKEHE